MDNSQYFTVDARSPNWSPIHALSFMIYHEAMIAGAHGGHTDVLNMQLLNNPAADNLPVEAYNAVLAIQEFFANHSDGGVVQHIDAEILKTELSPHIFALYQSLALLPQNTPEAINETKQLLTEFLGTREKAEAFMAISKAQAPEITHMLGASQPIENVEPNHQSCFKSPALTSQLFSIFCNDGQVPHIFQDSSLFGCFEHDTNYGKRYGLKQTSDGTFKLLINKEQPAVSATFEQAFFNREGLADNDARYSTQNAPRGLSYYFGSIPFATRTLLGLASVISAVIGVLYILKRFMKNRVDNDNKQSATTDAASNKHHNQTKPVKHVRFSEPVILSKESPARANTRKTNVQTARTNDKRWGRRGR